MIKPHDPSLIMVTITARDDMSSQIGMGLFLIGNGFQPGEDLITLFPMSGKRHFTVQFRSLESRDQFLGMKEEEGGGSLGTSYA